MTINDLIAVASQHTLLIVLLLGPLPVLAWFLGRSADDAAAEAPWKHLYSALVYAACVPGIMAAVLTAYSLFFTRTSLLDVNVFVYLLPIVIMFLTLAAIARDVEFDLIPGFDRISGLMLILGISFAIALFVVKVRIWLLFGSSMTTLLFVALIAFLLLRWGSQKLFR